MDQIIACPLFVSCQLGTQGALVDFTYPYFVYLRPQLHLMQFHRGKHVDTMVLHNEEHRNTIRGYICSCWLSSNPVEEEASK
ncbi:hypothetical protein PanWU01x14_095590 [Parasponia andersonii]|uniref:Uncharacterized protein n=1 Tax=Parasponia andersonii TaxID=3476 RepID=A0A2P5D550_PARAD|nr:hypothetical protein PanWU01x14_095590 [Parasponia andersonii]